MAKTSLQHIHIEGGYTRSPHLIRGAILEGLFTPTEVLVILALERHTYGHHKEWVTLSIRQLAQLAGKVGGRSAERAVSALVNKGLVARRRRERVRNWDYRLNLEAFAALANPPLLADLDRQTPSPVADSSPLNPPVVADLDRHQWRTLKDNKEKDLKESAAAPGGLGGPPGGSASGQGQDPDPGESSDPANPSSSPLQPVESAAASENQHPTSAVPRSSNYSAPAADPDRRLTREENKEWLAKIAEDQGWKY